MEQITFGEFIKKARISLDISLRELAKKMDISHSYLSQLENGHNSNPSADIILKLSEELDISFTYLQILLGNDEFLTERLTPEILNNLIALKPSEIRSFKSFSDFENYFIKNGGLIRPDKNDELETEKYFLSLQVAYNQLEQRKNIEMLSKDLAVVSQISALGDKLHEFNKIMNSISSEESSTIINLDSNNEGDYLFYKEGEQLQEDLQEKLKLIIKTILD